MVKSIVKLIAIAILIEKVSIAGEEYKVAVLGDLHYNATNLASIKPHRKWTIENWEDETRSRALLRASASLVDDSTGFAIQLGDLTDGYYLNHQVCSQALKQATDELKSVYTNIPVVCVPGNHDRNGRSPLMNVFHANELTSEFKHGKISSTFGFKYKGDLWIVVDFNKGEKTFQSVAHLLVSNQDVRYVFVVVHGPVLPMELYKSRSFYLGNQKLDGLRRHMRRLLAKRNAIVIAGHSHHFEYKDWYGDDGRITEVVVNSVVKTDENGDFVKEQLIRSSPSHFGAWLEKSKFAGEGQRHKFQFLYNEYKPGLREYSVYRASGHYVLRVSDGFVYIDYYRGTNLNSNVSIRLR